MMRTYPTNSPEAAGRVLAIGVLSDGNCSAVGLETLRLMRQRHFLPTYSQSGG